MLTAMVTLGPAAARLILMKLNWESPNWETLPKRSSLKVRSSLSSFPDGDCALVKFYLIVSVTCQVLLMKIVPLASFSHSDCSFVKVIMRLLLVVIS
jgi:hypothetical protein